MTTSAESGEASARARYVPGRMRTDSVITMPGVNGTVRCPSVTAGKRPASTIPTTHTKRPVTSTSEAE
jgi:hypothetical protein